MSREASVRAHVRSLAMLSQAVTAMKSLSAHHFRVARDSLASARTYRSELEAAVSNLPAGDLGSGAVPARLLVIGADLGLCAQYHGRIVEAAREAARSLGGQAADCIGRRTAALLARAGIAVRTRYAAPTSVEKVTSVLLDVVTDLFAEYRSGSVGSVHVVSARFGGIGEFEPVQTRLLPLEPLPDGGPPPSRYVSEWHLLEVAARERLFVHLEELLLDAMASEHGMRLVATNAAGDWLDAELERGRRRLRAIRQEASTQEILELVAAARASRRSARHPRASRSRTRWTRPE
ncbi:MAG TPA: F0F1 ATP synthase subunit gamma [Polyangiaceae bacterium]|nr:F0F1 ATP synthase subunit gamma [Polyangiaceae bacterium]